MSAERGKPSGFKGNQGSSPDNLRRSAKVQVAKVIAVTRLAGSCSEIAGQRTLDGPFAGTHLSPGLHPKKEHGGCEIPKTASHSGAGRRIPGKTVPCLESVWCTLMGFHLTMTLAAG